MSGAKPSRKSHNTKIRKFLYFTPLASRKIVSMFVKLKSDEIIKFSIKFYVGYFFKFSFWATGKANKGKIKTSHGSGFSFS